ncbi:epidermal growth factor receptor substrate 15 isoform X2 [Paralichthys olivaceus]|uniref:epidermal growth factor receptor substrate 15 isoform X2 n=1 Tax=Paralichthys olivaceus TaxID=8255 RepID=UPI003752154A
MAASLSLTQLSSGNPIYDKYYRQVDPTGSGRVTAADAALFLKRSGLADLVLGKIWDLADSERKGFLSKQQFFIALRLVACAQNGLEVALKSLNVAVPPPKFHDTSSPQLAGGAPGDTPWVVKPEEKMKFDSIFESLGPVGGILTGDKVKPVLLNSKLPVDILGRVWELSDLDRDGMLDKDEFSVAMYLVYRALEGEHVPMSLPPPLVPPSKRKKPSVPPVMPLLPSPPSAKDSRSAHAGSKTIPHPPKPAPAPVPAPAAASWVVSPADKAKYDDLFNKTDGDMDGLVSGPEVRDIFLKTGLPSATLARIWEVCDIGDIGKLTREQFALALYLINQKLTKGLDPPQSLTPEMIPPSDRQNIKQNNMLNLAADFSAIKELDSLSNEIVELQREKSSVEEEIKEKEEAIRQHSCEVQDLQDEVGRESGELQRLQTQRQKVQETLEELDQQKGSLEEQLAHIRQQTTQETQLISSLQSEHEEQEQMICQYEEELVQAREELLALQEESRRLQEKVQAAQEQLTPLQESVQQKLNNLQVEERSVTAQLSWKRALEDSSPVMVNGAAGTAAELHQGDPFQQDLFQEDQPKELKLEEPAAVCSIQKEHSDQKEKGANENEEEEEMQDKEDESPNTPDEEKPRSDALDDLYSSLASSDMYNSLSTFTKPRDNTVREFSNHEVSSEVADDADRSSNESSPKVASSDQENKQEQAEMPESTTTPSLPVGPLPPQTSPPTLPEMDFFHSDPFTDHDPFKDDPFGKADVADPFGGDPFKGTDPFAADSFFTQTSSAPFSSEDPFSAPADPFGATTGAPEPDLFAAKLNNAAPAPAAGPDPFTSKPTNPASAAKDPFTTTGNNMAESDPFCGKVNATTEADPFGSQDGETDPFSSSPVSCDLAVKDTAVANDPFAPGGTTVSASLDADPFAAVFGNESFGGGFADFSALTKSNGADQFGINNKNLFEEDSPSTSPDVPPALPPKTGTPTRPPPPPPGKKSSISRTESSDSFHRRGHFLPQPSGDFSSSSSSPSLPAKDPLADPFAPSSPPRHNVREADRFASFDKYPTEEDMIEWAKRESEREEKERLARLTQQEQEDLELAIALSKSELS